MASKLIVLMTFHKAFGHVLACLEVRQARDVLEPHGVANLHVAACLKHSHYGLRTSESHRKRIEAH